ncbi:NUDIX hydrolase [Desertihabitans brevis]|uniref:NUDIX hydrolase n=1 Tax=Desertihabitans brevis TaxID=2268447 RepID=A0A367YZY4_9ACTN|nr:NUDIX hydrolase [Desertihabitans brevis]RCK71069.1 NUDIX hydrolase [Desertihabitans brevis]
MSEPTGPPARELKIQVRRADGVGTLSWRLATSSDELARALSAVGDDAILGGELRRLEVSLPASDRVARRAVLRAGFRQEGVRRLALRTGADSYEDVVLYARLASDVVHGATGFSGVMNSTLPRTRVIAHVLFRRADGRFLFCTTTFKEDWELPGGVVEPRESPRAGAVREVREELGIDVTLGPLLAVDWLPPWLGWDDAVELIFDGGELDESQIRSFQLEAHEIAEVHWCTPEEAAPHLRPGAARRLAVLAASPGGTHYLEDGAPPA